MNIRLSKTLRKHLDTGLLEAQRSGNLHLMIDIIFLSLTSGNMSHAGHILRKLLKDWEIYQLRTRVERDIAKEQSRKKNTTDETITTEDVLSHVMAGIAGYCISPILGNAGKKSDKPQVATANSGHFVLWMLDNPEFISTRTLELYGITPEKIYDYLRHMPADEDYYAEIEILEKLNKQKDKEIVLRIEDTPEQDVYEDGDSEDYLGSSSRKTKSDSGTITIKSKSRPKSALEPFGINLSIAAAKGKLDPVIGREKEIERLIQILGRRKKNNPILIGEAGVGKSAIVEGLALRIASGSVPRSLMGKEVFSLDIASLIAGTKYRGEFEQRIKALINELQSNKDIILFIDEIHTINGAGSTQGSLDTANILKPALARGEIQCIGATTLDEYRENIESDSALERRFQKILVEPATKEQTLAILHNIKAHYERHHMVRYTDEALKACVDLTDRYITDRNFPDKAIDVLDEAGSKARLFSMREPKAIQEMEASLNKLLQEHENGNLDVYANPDNQIKVIALNKKINEYRADWQREIMLNPFVLGVEHIEEIITSMTGIPVEKVSQGEKKRLGKMTEHLSGKVIGQDTAVEKVSKSIQRSRTGLKDPNKPIGVFMFVGPTGVGKTHLTKELAKWMFDKPDSLIRVDMSEYSEKHNVSRMIGSPPGYVGYNEGGQLTEAVRRQPYAVVLFDEIEKAHPDVFNIMLQIFDEGQLTDGLGRKVDFRNTIIIMTSNVGSRAVAQKPKAVGYVNRQKERIEILNKESEYRNALERTFAPEFINRIDDIVIFNTLTKDDVQKIVTLELKELIDRVKALGYNFNITPCARKRLAAMGYESKYGVRSLKRTILDLVEEPIAQLIVGEELEAGDTIRVECRGDSIEVLKQAVLLKKIS